MSTTTTDPNDPKLNQTDPTTGLQATYLVLPQLEPELNPQKQWKRPYRDAYVHKGLGPQYPIRKLTESEERQHDGCRYVAYEPYPPIRYPITGRFWTQRQLDDAIGCNQVTVISQEIATTYAKDPKFYGATYCYHCRKHLSVDQFVWVRDGQRVGS